MAVPADTRSVCITWSARLGLVLACCASALDCSGGDNDDVRADGGGGHSSVDAGLPAAGSGGASGSRADAGGAGGAPALPACRIPDNIAIESDDADGGAPSDCHDVPRVIIANNCTGTICHYAGKDRRAGLDLMSACVADRLLGVDSSTCQGKQLIDPENPEQSFVLDKLNHEQPACGVHMPLGGHLPDAQVTCLNAWVHAVIRTATNH